MSIDRPRTIVVAVDDLFFSTRIETVARQTGATLALAQDEEQLARCLEKEVPALIIVDLNGRNCSPLDFIRRVKADPRLAGVPMIGFFSHVQVELERAAREAGCDRVLARSAFSSRLPDILRSVDG